MGHTQSVIGSQSRSGSMSSESGMSLPGRSKQAREHKRHGVVTLKMISANPTGRRETDRVITHTITPRGCILYPAAMFNPTVVQRAIATSGYPLLPPTAIPLADPRAHKIMVSYCNGWHIIPFPEVFSRHSGTCLILGDRQITSPPFQMKVGDCFRLGSVGLVVSEMRADGETEQRIDGKTLDFLRDEALAFDTSGDLATLAADEERLGMEGAGGAGSSVEGDGEGYDQDGDGDGDGLHTPPRMSSVDSAGETPQLNLESPYSPHKDNNKGGDTSRGTHRSQGPAVGSGGIAPGERFVCYMCYETHDTEDDALVAPCECRGDTRYLHVQCLQKWYQASITGVQTQVIRTTGNGAPACKICGSAYKTAFRRADGRKASLLEMESNGPYLSLVVVTKHDTNPGLFNTKFRLNFHSAPNRQDVTWPYEDPAAQDNIITIGRSSSCNMILDYRTVSTIHARITYEDGKFYLTDRRSSNGTMVYLQDPFPLPYQHSLKLRMGRTTLSLQAKRNWTSTLRNFFGAPLPLHDPNSPSPEEVQEILASCTAAVGSGLGASDHGDCLDRTVRDDSLAHDGDELQRLAGEGRDGEGASPLGGMQGGDSRRSPQDLGVEGGTNNWAAGSAAVPNRASGTGLPYGRAYPDGEASVRSLNSLGNTSFQSLGSAATGMTGLNTLQVAAGSVPRMHVGGHHTYQLGVRGSSVGGVVGVRAGEADDDGEEEEVRRAIELSLMELALQQQQQEQAALERQQQEGGREGRSPGTAQGLPPIDRAHSPFAPQGQQQQARPHSSRGSPAVGAGTGTGITKSPSKALLDYSQPELVSDSTEDIQQVPALSGIGALKGGSHESTLVSHSSLEGMHQQPTSPSGIADASARSAADELSTTLPTAGAFTPYGQLSSRRSNSNFQQGQESGREKGTLTKEGSVTFKEGTRDNSREGRERESKGTMSRENSLRARLSRESSVSSSTGALPPGAGAGIAEKKGGAAPPGSAEGGRGAGEDGEGERVLQHNATTLDLDSAPSP